MSSESGNFVPETDLVRASGDGMTDRRPEPDFVTKVLNLDAQKPKVILGQAAPFAEGEVIFDAGARNSISASNGGESSSSNAQ